MGKKENMDGVDTSQENTILEDLGGKVIARKKPKIRGGLKLLNSDS